MGDEKRQTRGAKFGAGTGADSLSLRQRAIRLLAGREHTRSELTKKLNPYATADEILAVLDELQALDLVSDERAAASYVRTHAARLGRTRLAQALRARGISGELATEQLDTQLDTETDNDEFQRAHTLWNRKFGNVPKDAKDWARQARFLQYRGFSTDVIRRILRDAKQAAIDSGEANK
jgi:regulatory protein